jgi:hypothetical protein
MKKKREQNEDLNVGRGKVEIRNQDSHFSTAQISLRRKEKRRLHKTLDVPPVAQLAPPPPVEIQWGALRDRIKLLPGWDDPVELERFLAGDI